MLTRTDGRFDCLDDWLEWQQTLHPRKIDLGLERVKRVFAALHPGYLPPITITVGGTNGKGSCIALLEAILCAQGISTGCYTSPHILRYNERIRIAGQPQPDEAICEAFARIDAVRGEASLSFFEFGTLAALDLFSRAQVEVQLLEVGLGGRLDAVNIIDADVAIITSIDIDHKEWLGEDRETIGAEKAGIFRSHRPAVIGDRVPPRSLLERARKLGVRLSRIGRDFDCQLHEAGWDWCSEDDVLRNLPYPALPGRQQFDNAATVIAAMRMLEARLDVSESALRQGLEGVRLPGRYQKIPAQPEILLDVAHNPQAAGFLADYVKTTYPGRRIKALFTVMADKDLEGIVARMKDVVDVWALAPLPANPRTATEPRLLEAFKAVGLTSPLHGFDGWKQALQALMQDTEGHDLILVFGSFFLIAEFLADHGH